MVERWKAIATVATVLGTMVTATLSWVDSRDARRQSSHTQASADRIDVEKDAAYKAILEELRGQAKTLGELREHTAAEGARVDFLERMTLQLVQRARLAAVVKPPPHPVPLRRAEQFSLPDTPADAVAQAAQTDKPTIGKMTEWIDTDVAAEVSPAAPP